jgi:hypothetical protein
MAFPWAMVLWAAGVVLGARLVAAPMRRWVPGCEDCTLALGVAGGYFAALWATGTRPGLPLAPSDSAWTWTLWFALAGGALGVLEVAARLPRVVRLLVRFCAGVGAAWLLVRPVVAIPSQDRGPTAAVAGLAATVVWTTLARADRTARAAHGPALAGSTVVAGLCSSWLFFHEGHNVTLAMAMGALVVATFVLVLPLPGLRGLRIPYAAAGAVALPYVGLCAAALWYLNYGDVVRFPLPTAALLALAPITGWFVPGHHRPSAGALLGALAALLPAGAALLLAGILSSG